MKNELLLLGSVIVIYGDHDARISKKYYNIMHNYDPYTDTVLTSEDEGYILVNDYTMEVEKNVPFIIWTKDEKFNKEVSTVAGMIDVLPTLGNMFNIHSDYQMGKDILSLKKDDNKFGKIQIEEAKRYYLGVHCVQYSNEDYTIKFMNNVYTPTVQQPVVQPVAQTQIDLQIGNQYMNVNGVARLIDNNGTMPVLSNGRTMLPIRAVIEALGGTIEWDANTFTTTVTLRTKNIKIKIGDKVAYVNGVAKSLDVPAQLINQRTMLPLRFIMENLGGNVTWEDATQIVRIKY